LEDRIEAIVIGPGPGDLSLIEGLTASSVISIIAVVADTGDVSALWCAERGIPRFNRLRDVPRLLPGQLLVLLAEDTVELELPQGMSSQGFSILGREVANLICPQSTGPAANHDRIAAALRGYLKLLEDFFPASRKASSMVKLAACLTEVTTTFAASGGAILTGVPGGNTLAVAAYTGADLSGEPPITKDDGSFPARCYSRGKPEVAPDLAEGNVKLLGSVRASSAACVPIRSGQAMLGVVLLWSDQKGCFEQADIAPVSLFGCYVATLLEIDELSTRLEESLVIDPLTGLHNRFQFDHRLSLEVRRAQRYSLNVSLLVFDVDHLEEYNQSCGHMLGNLALSDIASIFNKGAREVDFLARVGEDEFAIILPETGRLGAIRLAERLRSEVAAYPFPIPENRVPVPVTVSGGISSFPNCGDNEHDLVARAYQALDDAKREGANIVKLWESERATK